MLLVDFTLDLVIIFIVDGVDGVKRVGTRFRSLTAGLLLVLESNALLLRVIEFILVLFLL